jgi:YD repeat-containing protein
VNGVAADDGLYGQIKKVIDPNGAEVSSTYDVFGRALTVTDPAGNVTTNSYNSFGTIGSQHVKTDSPLSISSWTYFDGLGRTIKSNSTGADSKIVVTDTEYGVRGQVARTSLPYFEVGGIQLTAMVIGHL